MDITGPNCSFAIINKMDGTARVCASNAGARLHVDIGVDAISQWEGLYNATLDDATPYGLLSKHSMGIIIIRVFEGWLTIEIAEKEPDRLHPDGPDRDLGHDGVKLILPIDCCRDALKITTEFMKDKPNWLSITL